MESDYPPGAGPRAARAVGYRLADRASLISDVTDQAAIVALLLHLGLPARAPPLADLELARAQTRTGVLRKSLRLVVRPEARALPAELGCHPMWGVRSLEWVIEVQLSALVAARTAADATLRERDLVVEAEGWRIVLR